MRLFKDLWHVAGDEWYLLPGRLRARVLFYAVAALGLMELAAFLDDLVRDRDLETLAYLAGALTGLLLVVVRAAILFSEPYTYSLSPKKVGQLTADDLDVLEVLLGFERAAEGDELHRAVRTRREDEGRPLPPFDRVQGQWVMRDVLASLKRLRFAGLVHDKRERLYDQGILVGPAEGAADVLEQERLRRDRVARIGPRSRPGPLSA